MFRHVVLIFSQPPTKLSAQHALDESGASFRDYFTGGGVAEVLLDAPPYVRLSLHDARPEVLVDLDDYILVAVFEKKRGESTVVV